MELRSVIFLLVFLVGVGKISAQNAQISKKDAKIYKKVVDWYTNENKEKAFKKAGKYLRKHPDFLKLKLYYAGMYYEENLHNEAYDVFDEITKKDPNYNKRIYFTMAYSAWKNGDFGLASVNAKKYLELEKKNKPLIRRAEKIARDANFAPQAIGNPVPFDPKSIGDGINKVSSSEYLPTLRADGLELVFTKRIKGQEDFYVSELVDGVWTEAVAIEELNSPQNEGAQSLSADGKTLVFTMCNRSNSYGSCDLFISRKQNDVWMKAENMGPDINTKHWESEPSLSADGNRLYFSSDRPGGKGNKDIWYSDFENGQWNLPLNFAHINTSDIEGSPFIHQDGLSLYFMSRGHPGMGEEDLFLVRKNGSSWGKINNLGYPINTAASEGALMVNLEGDEAYYASDRKYLQGNAVVMDKTFPETDIYKFSLDVSIRPLAVSYVKAIIRDEKTNERISAQLDIYQIEKNELMVSALTEEDGFFLVPLISGDSYAINVSKAGYVFFSDHVDLNQEASIMEPRILEIMLTPIEAKEEVVIDDEAPVVEKVVILRNVFFETASAALLDISMIELDRLVSMMNENAEMKIRIQGHTDDVGNEEDNMKLSVARAESVFNYLISQGIGRDRLSYIGLGEQAPITSNDTEEGRRQNRRTEFVVIDK